MLYELLTGRPPFRGATAMATLREVMEAEPAAPRRLKAEIPPDLETICLKCLEKSPSARYPTARALAEELDRFLKGEPIQARPASVLRKAVSWARRHPGALSAVAALVMVTLAFGIFYLFEENAFLLAQQANPTLARVRGPLHESFEFGARLAAVATATGVFSLIALRGLARGLSFKHWLHPALLARPLQPLGERTRTFAIGVGLIVVGCGVMLLVKTIQAHVWEGESIWRQMAVVYLSIFWGLAILGIVIRDYRLVHFGTSSRQLTAEQIEPIRRAMEDWDVVTAINLYREAVPDADVAEANQYVGRLAESLRAQHPGKFVPPPLSLATLNWKAMGICGLIEAVILGVLLYALPLSSPVLAIPQFAFSLLFGMGLVAGLRLKGFWKWMLLAAPPPWRLWSSAKRSCHAWLERRLTRPGRTCAGFSAACS